jgi:hypothetical protein
VLLAESTERKKKEMKPQMNTDKHRRKDRIKEASLCSDDATRCVRRTQIKYLTAEIAETEDKSE